MSAANTSCMGTGSASPTAAISRRLTFAHLTPLVILIFLTTASLAQAQFDGGKLLGTVADADGNLLSEVEVTVAANGHAYEAETDEEGKFRFGELEPGNYSLEAFLEGFSKAVYEPVHIRIGRPTTVRVQMSPAIEETITITSEPPDLGVPEEPGRKFLRSDELARVSAANDLFAAVDQAPEVLAHGGSGLDPRRDSVYSPGLGPAAFEIDGTPVESAGGGLSPLASGTGRAAGVNVVSGGTDPALTGGAVLDLTTRSGIGEIRAAARVLYADGGWQSAPQNSDGELSDRILDVADVGIDVGGPIFQDTLWGWGSLGEQQIRRQATGGLVEDLGLEQAAAKLNARLGPSHTAVASYFWGEGHSLGRGAGPDRSLESTLDEVEPSQLLRFETQHLPTPDFQITAHYSRLESSAYLRALGGSDAEILLGEDGIWRGTYGDFDFAHDADVARLETLGFLDRPKVDHELAVGLDWRRLASASSERWGRQNLVHVAGENLGLPLDLVRAVRPANLEVDRDLSAVWVRDRIAFGRFTVDLGFRYDYQQGMNRATSVAAHPVFPEALPAVETGGNDAGFTWKSMSPRAGFTWAIDREGRNLLRASFARFASPLSADLVSRTNPAARSEVGFFFEDRNQDGIFDAEIDQLLEFQVLESLWGGTGLGQGVHTNATGLQPEITDELRVGFEHEVRRDLVIGLDLVERRTTDILETRQQVVDESGRLRLARRWDYVLDQVLTGELPDGDPFSVPLYSLRSGLEFAGGAVLANGDRSQRYRGMTFSFDKRLANSWMLRGDLAWNDWNWRLGPYFRTYDDPNNAAPALGDFSTIDPADDDGGAVTYDHRLPGQDDGRFLNSRWAFHLFGLYQVAPSKPWGFNVAASFNGREGYPVPYTVAAVADDNRALSLEVAPEGELARLEDVYTIDLRLEKELALGRGPLRAIVSLDAFNLLNAENTLEIERQVNGPQAGQVREVLSPRIFRLGVRLSWK